MSKIPNVNFMLEFYLPKYNNSKMQDKRNYYSSNKTNDYIKYIDTGIKDLKNIDYVEYANNRTKSSGIFDQNGKLTKEQISDLRKDLRNTKSVIWSGVISFEEDFGKKWCNNFDLAYNIMKSEVPKFFKRVGLKKDNMTWFAGLHENTDNRHIHFIFFENKPIRLRNNKKAYSIGKLSNKGINEFKANIELCATDFKAREIKIRTKCLKNINENLRELSSLKLKSKLVNLGYKLPKNGHTYYDCENMKNLKNIIDDITNYIINKNEKVKKYKEDFDELVKEKDELLINYCSRNKIKKPYKSVGDKMKGDLFNRIGNIVIEKAKLLKSNEIERLKLNAKIKTEKILQKKKLSRMLNECFYLNNIIEYEAIKSFQKFLSKLEEMRIKNMIEQGLIIDQNNEMY